MSSETTLTAFTIPVLEVQPIKQVFLTTIFDCKCGRRYKRTLDLPIDAEGRPARLPLPEEFKFSCVECNRGKESPRLALTPETHDAVLRFIKASVSGREPVSAEDIAWKLHVKQESVAQVVSQWRRANAEDEAIED